MAQSTSIETIGVSGRSASRSEPVSTRSRPAAASIERKWEAASSSRSRSRIAAASTTGCIVTSRGKATAGGGGHCSGNGYAVLECFCVLSLAEDTRPAAWRRGEELNAGKTNRWRKRDAWRRTCSAAPHDYALALPGWRGRRRTHLVGHRL